MLSLPGKHCSSTLNVHTPLLQPIRLPSSLTLSCCDQGFSRDPMWVSQCLYTSSDLVCTPFQKLLQLRNIGMLSRSMRHYRTLSSLITRFSRWLPTAVTNP